MKILCILQNSNEIEVTQHFYRVVRVLNGITFLVHVWLYSFQFFKKLCPDNVLSRFKNYV